MSKPGEFRAPKPIDFIEAWTGGVMSSDDAKRRAQEIATAYPVPAGISDPIFYTPEYKDGERVIVWHQARTIQSPQAMVKLKAYLYDRGISLPAEIGLAWASIMERQQWGQAVRVTVESAIAASMEDPETRSVVDVIDNAIKALRESVV